MGGGMGGEEFSVESELVLQVIREARVP